MKKNIRIKQAIKIYEQWLATYDDLKTTPVYCNFLHPIFSSLLQNSIPYYDESELGDSLTLESEGKVVTISNLNGAVHFSVFLTSKGEASEIRTLFDIECRNYMQSASLDINIIQNICREIQGKVMVSVEEEHRCSNFNNFGLECARTQEIFTLSSPAFVRRLEPNMILTRKNSERKKPIRWNHIVSCPMKKVKDVQLKLRKYYASVNEPELPPVLQSPIVVAAGNPKEDYYVSFPYFHDPEGWIITEPFLSDEKTRLSIPTDPISGGYDSVFIGWIDEKLMGRCNKMAMKEYLAWLEKEQGKLAEVKEDAQSMVLRYFSKV